MKNKKRKVNTRVHDMTQTFKVGYLKKAPLFMVIDHLIGSFRHNTKR